MNTAKDKEQNGRGGGEPKQSSGGGGGVSVRSLICDFLYKSFIFQSLISENS